MIRLRWADFNLDTMSQNFKHSTVSHAPFLYLTPPTSFRVLKYYAYAPPPKGSLRGRFAPLDWDVDVGVDVALIGCPAHERQG